MLMVLAVIKLRHYYYNGCYWGLWVLNWLVAGVGGVVARNVHSIRGHYLHCEGLAISCLSYGQYLVSM